MVFITLDHVSLDYPVRDVSRTSLKSDILRLGAGGLIQGDSRRVFVRSLDDLSLELREGDRLGLVGPNGAGKSSLLRVIAGIYAPTSGRAAIRGKPSALFDLSLGVDTELSGYENIKLRGLALGLSRASIRLKAEEIAEFSGLEEFLNMPVYTYSSGMRLRLAFAISTAVEPEILVMDEVVGAGDAQFLEKARQRLDSLVQRTSILVVASHSPTIITRLCNRALWLDRGRIRAQGPADQVLRLYEGEAARG